jgi:hypothetical protein
VQGTGAGEKRRGRAKGEERGDWSLRNGRAVPGLL